MARDHRKLRVFHLAHELTIGIYKATRDFPREEWFGMRQQLRRAAVSVPSNLVEGSARRSGREYCNFINIARGSASEVGYLLSLATELGYMPPDAARSLVVQCEDLIPQLEMLLQRVEVEEQRRRPGEGKRPAPTEVRADRKPKA